MVTERSVTVWATKKVHESNAILTKCVYALENVKQYYINNQLEQRRN